MGREGQLHNCETLIAITILAVRICEPGVAFATIAGLAYSHKTNYTTKLHKDIKWNPPNAHLYKLNTERAYSLTKAGIGGVIRNSKAEWILGFAGAAPCKSAIFSELYALMQGLRYAYERNITPLEVEVDAKDIILLLHTENFGLFNLIVDCRYYLGLLGNPTVKHVYREKNMVSDQLAKVGHNFGDAWLPRVFEAVPIFVAPVFERDRACMDQSQSGQQNSWHNDSGNMAQLSYDVISCHDDNPNRMTMTTVNSSSNLWLDLELWLVIRSQLGPNSLMKEVEPNNTKLCELCYAHTIVFCTSDCAFICYACDTKVHSANFLVVCHICITLSLKYNSLTANYSCSCSPKPAHSLSSSSSACIQSSTNQKRIEYFDRRRHIGSFWDSSVVVNVSSGEVTSSTKPSQRRSIFLKNGALTTRLDSRTEDVFLHWCNKLGLYDEESAVRMTRDALALRLDQGSLWFGLRLTHSMWQSVKSVEHISGGPAKLILATEVKLQRFIKASKQRRQVLLEEGWDESSP
uniref:Uncharacterized protein LOC104234226 n=1 Tax=Nicotiana sylvestris TaxID=4096 RepID=A0A1U7X1P7_NICSY|nr:PREDICTED: uncharacterized protein LOC104234226 [Nicotiana sylvestris]